MGNEITIEGIPELMAKLEAMNVKVDAVAGQALKEAGGLVVEEAKTTTAFTDRTGKLREFLKVSQVRSSAGTKYVFAGIDRGDNSKVFYGKFIEFGSSHQPAKPFLGPAYENKKEEMKELIKIRLQEALK